MDSTDVITSNRRSSMDSFIEQYREKVHKKESWGVLEHFVTKYKKKTESAGKIVDTGNEG